MDRFYGRSPAASFVERGSARDALNSSTPIPTLPRDALNGSTPTQISTLPAPHSTFSIESHSKLSNPVTPVAH